MTIPALCQVALGPTPDPETASNALSGPGALPVTGTTPITWLVVAAVLVVVGTIIITIARRRHRTINPLVALAVVATLASIVTVATPRAASAEPAISYQGDCTLIHIDHLRGAPDATELLPGDTTTVLAATVTNPTADPVGLSFEAHTDPDSPLADLLTVTSTPAGHTLTPGASSDIAVTIALPSTATNNLQADLTTVTLLITATQR